MTRTILAKTPKYKNVCSIWGTQYYQWKIEELMGEHYSIHLHLIIHTPYKKKSQSVGWHKSVEDALDYLSRFHFHYEAGHKAHKYLTRKLKEKGLIND